MINQQDLDELKQDMIREAREDEWHERQMRNNMDYVIQQLSLSEDSTLAELDEACLNLTDYDWQLSIYDLIEEIR